MLSTLVTACDAADIDATTGVCAHPYWVDQQTFFPPLDTVSAVTIGIAILTCWAVAYGLRTLRRVGD